MAFDIDMIKLVYSRLSERLAEARKLTGRPYRQLKKFYILTFGNLQKKELFHVDQIMWILLLIELLVKMQLHKLLYCSLCNLESLSITHYQPPYSYQHQVHILHQQQQNHMTLP